MTCEYCKEPIEPVNNFGQITGEGIVLLAEVDPSIDREVHLHCYVCLPSWLYRNQVWIKFVRIPAAS